MKPNFQKLGQSSKDGGTSLKGGGTTGGVSSVLMKSMAQNPLEWTELGLGAAGAVGGGIEAYLTYQERKRQQKLQEELARNADRRAEEQWKLEQRAYEEGGTQRGANTLATMAPVVSQGQTFRDRLRLLGGLA